MGWVITEGKSSSGLNFKRLSSAWGPKNLGLLYFSAKLGQHKKKTIP